VSSKAEQKTTYTEPLTFENELEKDVVPPIVTGIIENQPEIEVESSNVAGANKKGTGRKFSSNYCGRDY
jgi:hypothetical protein